MNKFSRVLTIFVTVFSIAFMSVAAVTVAARTDWKDIAKTKYPKTRISEQQQTIRDLDEKITALTNEQKLAIASIESDVKALTDPTTGHQAAMEHQLTEIVQNGQQVAKQIEDQARKADVKLETLALRRDDVARLQNQYEEFVSQKEAAEAEAKRLRDLLVQAQGNLDRVERRRDLLEAEKNSPAYDDEGGKN